MKQTSKRTCLNARQFHLGRSEQGFGKYSAFKLYRFHFICQVSCFPPNGEITDSPQRGYFYLLFPLFDCEQGWEDVCKLRRRWFATLAMSVKTVIRREPLFDLYTENLWRTHYFFWCLRSTWIHHELPIRQIFILIQRFYCVRTGDISLFSAVIAQDPYWRQAKGKNFVTATKRRSKWQERGLIFVLFQIGNIWARTV